MNHAVALSLSKLKPSNQNMAKLFTFNELDHAIDEINGLIHVENIMACRCCALNNEILMVSLWLCLGGEGLIWY